MPVAVDTEHRQLLLAAYLQDENVQGAAAARAAGCNRAVASKWLARFRAGDLSLEDAPRSGRPARLSKIDIARARRHLKHTKGATMSSALELINKGKDDADKVSLSTLKRALGDLHYGLIEHEVISPANVDKRSAATTPGMIRSMRLKLVGMVFLDATYVRFKPGHPIKGHKFEKGWQSAGELAPYDGTKYTLCCLYAAMVMLPDGTVIASKLIWAPPTPGTGASLNSSFVKQKVLTPLRAWLRKVQPQLALTWLRDGAKVHTSDATLAYEASHGMVVVDHPAQSPDLNPIERVWAVMKQSACNRTPRTWEGFYKIMGEEWECAVKKMGSKAISELPEVMRAVHAAPGRHVTNVKH